MISLRAVLDHPTKTAIAHSRNQNGVMILLFQTNECTRRQNAHLLRPTGKITKGMTPAHRVDTLTDFLIHYARKSISALGKCYGCFH